MKTVILAAGKGERLGSLSEKIPKPMIVLRSEPIILENIRLCKKAGVSEFYINLHHLPEVITQYLGDGSKWGVKIHYQYEPELLGTAGSVKKLEPELRDERFFVIYGDNYGEFDLSEIRAEHVSKGAEMTIVLFEQEEVRLSGVAITDSEGWIERFVEKPKTNDIGSHWINAGVYLMEPELLKSIEPGCSDFGRDVIPRLLASGRRVLGIKSQKKVLAIDTPELYDFAVRSVRQLE
jgi:mannose-1-phosphate guanylyltransferase